MSAFNNNGVTMKGAIIIASLVAGDTLTFTRIAVGDGVLPSGQTVLTTERLVNPLFNVPISSVTSDNAARATVKGAFNNANLATGFYYREIGLFAINPETNAEELFCYGNAGDLAEWINPVGESSLIEKEIHLVTLIGNATNVTAVFDENAKVLKSDFDAAMPLKADLDETPENGGRVLASQMRFDASQTLYVDAAAAAGGDGSEARPFKTIAAAINARYMGANVIFIKIKPGTYAEELSVPRSPGTTWRITREGDGTVAINTAVIDNCAYIYLNGLTFNGPIPANSTVVYVANVPSFNVEQVTINGNAEATGVNFSTSRGVMRHCSVNNCGLAIAATYGAVVDLQRNGGANNDRALHSDGGVIISDYYVPGATTVSETVNGGVVNVQDGHASFPSNYSQLFPLGDFTSADALKAAILKVFNELTAGEIRECWFINNISDGFGAFVGEQQMQIRIGKTNNSGAGYGVVFFEGHHNPPFGYMQIHNGSFVQDTPVIFAREEIATPASYGLMRVAAPVADELDSTCQDAALTPANVHAMANYRIANTYYNIGDVVAVPYHANLFMKCITAGRADSEPLVTIDAYDGQQIIDGGVTWEVGVVGKTPGEIIMYMGDTAPEGYLACDHGEVSRTTYARLFRIRGTKDGAGNGSTTFNLPNMNNGSFLEGSNTAGTVKSAGLPNIEGYFSGLPLLDKVTPSVAGDGRLYNVTPNVFGGYDSIASQSHNDSGGYRMDFNANKANAIYGNSDTVQPKSVTVKFCIKY